VLHAIGYKGSKTFPFSSNSFQIFPQSFEQSSETGWQGSLGSGKEPFGECFPRRLLRQPEGADAPPSRAVFVKQLSMNEISKGLSLICGEAFA
jgi:hypothetical protein